MVREYYVGTRAAALDDTNNMWISNAEFNGLIKCNLLSGKIQYIKSFEKYGLECMHLHGSAHIFNDNIIFFPFLCNTIAVYNLTSNQEEYFEIPCEENITFLPITYYYKDKYLIVPSNISHGIYYFDPSNRYVYYYEKFNQSIKEYLNYDRDIQVSYSVNYMVILFKNKKEYLVVDLDTFEKDIYKLSIDELVEKAIICDKTIWILLKDSFSIYSIDMRTNKHTKYMAEDVLWTRRVNVHPYSDLVETGDKEIVVSNFYANSLLILNKEKKVFEKFIINVKDYRFCGDSIYGPMISRIIRKNRKIYYIPLRASHLIIYDEITKEVDSLELIINSYADEKYKQKLLDKFGDLMLEDEKGLQKWFNKIINA